MKRTVNKKKVGEITVLKVIIVFEVIVIALMSYFNASSENVGMVEEYTTETFCEVNEEDFTIDESEECTEYATEDHAVIASETITEAYEYRPYTDYEVFLIAKTVYGEALVTDSQMEMAAVAWCILNRVDNARFPNSIEAVVTASNQFHGYDPKHPVTSEIEKLVRDVLERWIAEKKGSADVGRVLPADYCYFEGDGSHNHYTKSWQGGVPYDWSLSNPYAN